MTSSQETRRTGSTASVLTGVISCAGIVVSVAALNVDRTWRVAAFLLGAAGTIVLLAAGQRTMRRVPVAPFGVGLIILGGGILVFSPAPAAKVPQADLIVSKFEILPPTHRQPLRLDITLHNVGTRRAVLNTLKVRVKDFDYLPACYGAGNVPASARYPLAMPDRPAPGHTVTVSLHQQIGADQVDRFLVAVAAPPNRLNEDGLPVDALFAYRAMLSISTDVAERPVSLGEAVFTAPYTPSRWVHVWDLDDPNRAKNRSVRDFLAAEPEIDECLDRNSAALSDILRAPGTRPATLVPAGSPS